MILVNQKAGIAFFLLINREPYIRDTLAKFTNLAVVAWSNPALR